MAQVKLSRLRPTGVLTLDGADGGGCSEHPVHFVLIYHTEELSRVWCADRFSLVQDRRVAIEKRRITDILMPNDPSKV